MSAPSAEGAADDPWSKMMRAAMAGDEGAYRRLLTDIGRSVRAMARGAFARARLGDADIEDVVQETLLAIHLKRHTWDPGQKLGPWAHAIARHKIIDAMRRRGTRRVEPIEDFEDVPGRARRRGPARAERRQEAHGAAWPAPARHRAVDLARRPVDRGDRGAARHDRGRGPGRAAPGAEGAWRRLAEVDRVRTSELIDALAADPVPEPIQLGRRFAAALGARDRRRRAALPRLRRPAAGHRERGDDDPLQPQIRRCGDVRLALAPARRAPRPARRRARRARGLALRAARPARRRGRGRTHGRAGLHVAAPPHRRRTGCIARP